MKNHGVIRLRQSECSQLGYRLILNELINENNNPNRTSDQTQTPTPRRAQRETPQVERRSRARDQKPEQVLLTRDVTLPAVTAQTISNTHYSRYLTHSKYTTN